MPYELVTPVEGENLSRNAEEADKNWASYSDDGFLDTFLSLKKQMDFTRKQYRDQQNTLPLRKVQLRKQLIKSWFNVFLFILIIPVGLWILTDLFMKWGTTSGLASSVYLILKILLFPALFVSIFLAPQQPCRVQGSFRYRKLCGGRTFSESDAFQIRRI